MGINDLHIPFLAGNKTIGEYRQEWWDALQKSTYQRKLVLVTVSIALERTGMLSPIERVNRVWVLAMLGKTSLCAGRRRTSSKVRPRGISMCTLTFCRALIIREGNRARPCRTRTPKWLGPAGANHPDFARFQGVFERFSHLAQAGRLHRARSRLAIRRSSRHQCSNWRR